MLFLWKISAQRRLWAGQGWARLFCSRYQLFTFEDKFC